MSERDTIKTIVVLGNARSGTSMVAGILKILGVKMDAREYVDASNPKGDFESIEAHRINQRIYQLATGKVSDSELHWYPPPYERVLELKDNSEIQEMVKEFIQGKKGVWGWKNPKTSLTIELYLPLLKNPYFVIVTRDPLKVAESTVKMARLSLDRALEIVDFYNESIRRFLLLHPDLPCIFLSFEDIIRNPVGQSQKLADFLGLSLDSEKRKQIKKFVIPRNKIMWEKRKMKIKTLIQHKVKRAHMIFRQKGFLFLVMKTFKSLWEKAYSSISPLFLPYYIIRIRGDRSRDVHRLVHFVFDKHSKLIKASQIREEITSFLEILEKMSPKVVLEIGTEKGGTLFLFSRIASENAKLISIDLPEGKFGGGYPRWKIPLYKSFAKKGQKIYLIRSDSHNQKTLEEVKGILNGRKIDFLFIDGDHTYKGVKKDFEMYSPLVRKGGIIAFHDICPGLESKVGGVPGFWQAIKQNFDYKEIVQDWNQGGYGIGIIYC